MLAKILFEKKKIFYFGTCFQPDCGEPEGGVRGGEETKYKVLIWDK